jgi:hypothetical protein
MARQRYLPASAPYLKSLYYRGDRSQYALHVGSADWACMSLLLLKIFAIRDTSGSNPTPLAECPEEEKSDLHRSQRAGI